MVVCGNDMMDPLNPKPNENWPVTNIEITWKTDPDTDETERVEMTLTHAIAGTPTGRTRLRLCSQVGTLTFDEFTDERLGSIHDGEVGE